MEFTKKMFIDFKPALSNDALINRIDRDIEKLKAKQFSSLLEGFLPKSLVKVFAKRLGINLAFKANQVDKEKRKKLAELLKNNNAFVSMPVLFVICILFLLMISLLIFAN